MRESHWAGTVQKNQGPVKTGATRWEAPLLNPLPVRASWGEEEARAIPAILYTRHVPGAEIGLAVLLPSGIFTRLICADVAELADALDSKSS
jgi:hypothetical protein